MMIKNKFRRYYLIDTENLNRLENSIVVRDHLSETEDKLLSVIKNNRIPIDKRLQLYREVLFQSQAKRRAVESQNSENKNNRSMTTETQTFAPQFKTEEEQETQHVRQKTPEIFETNGERVENIFSKPPPPITRRRSLDFEDDFKGFDSRDQTFWDNERLSLISNLNRSFGGEVDLKRLSFRGLEDPNSTHVTAEDLATGTVAVVPKSKAIIRRQKEQANARRNAIDNARRLSHSAPPKRRPAQTPLEGLSPKKQKSGTPLSSHHTRSGRLYGLASYEDIGKRKLMIDEPAPMDITASADDENFVDATEN